MAAAQIVCKAFPSGYTKMEIPEETTAYSALLQLLSVASLCFLVAVVAVAVVIVSVATAIGVTMREVVALFAL